MNNCPAEATDRKRQHIDHFSDLLNPCEGTEVLCDGLNGQRTDPQPGRGGSVEFPRVFFSLYLS